MKHRAVQFQISDNHSYTFLVDKGIQLFLHPQLFHTQYPIWVMFVPELQVDCTHPNIHWLEVRHTCTCEQILMFVYNKLVESSKLYSSKIELCLLVTFTFFTSVLRLPHPKFSGLKFGGCVSKMDTL